MRGSPLLIGLILATGYVNSRTGLQDRLAQRVTPADVDLARPTSQPQAKASDRAPMDAKMQPAVASQAGPGIGTRDHTARSTPPGFNFLPGLRALPIGRNIGKNFELAELKVQWLLLDFGRRLGRYEQARLANEEAVWPEQTSRPR
jgi:hypothetical protein